MDKDGIPFDDNIEVGIMIEVPSAVVMADLMANEVDFFSIGTNDLIQYSLAIDRGNRQVAHLYQPFHPAIIRMIKQVADVSREKGIKCYMCGEMAGDILAVPILLGLGLHELSMNPQSIPSVKQMIRALNASEAKAFVKEVLKKSTAKEIYKLLEENYGKYTMEHLVFE